MSHDWAIENPTWDNVQSACRLGAKWQKKHDVSEEVNGEDYGIDGIWHAQRILEKTLGSVDGYQSDDGILDHRAAITAVKKLHKQKSEWSEEDKNLMYDTLSNLTELKDRFGEEYGRTGDCIEWLKSLKDRYTWKPSDDDINLLKEVEQALLGKDCHNRLVDFMWKLKKLKE
jgi:hypothetical protein